MSLTNDMLLNLEKQRSPYHTETNIPKGLKNTASNKAYYLTYGIYFLIVFVLLGAIVGIFYVNLQHLKSHVIQKNTIIVIKPPVLPSTFQKNKIPPAVKSTTLPNTPSPLPQQAQLISSKNELQSKTLQDINANSSEALLKTPSQESVEDIMTQRYQDALNLASQNQVSAAIDELKSMLRIVPNYQDARLALATLYLKNNDITKSVRLLADGLTLDPGNIPITLLYTRALLAEHQNADALRALNTIADSAGNNGDYMDLLASVQLSLSNYAQAISLYQNLLAQNPANTRWLINLGVALEKNKQNSDALATYKKAESTGQLTPNLQNYVSRRIHYLSGQ